MENSNQYEHNSFVLYKDSRIFIRQLDTNQRGNLLGAIFDYTCDGEIPDFHGDSMTQMCFEIIKSYLDRDEQKYQEKCRKNKENIEKRWAKTGKQSNTNVYSGKQSNTNCTDKDTDTDTDSVSVIDTDTDTVRDTDTDQACAVSGSADRPAGAAAAEGAAPQSGDLFSVKQLLVIAEKNKVNLTGEGVQVFHEEMQESGWILYDRPVEKKGIVKALRGWAKYHLEYSLDQEEPERPKAAQPEISQKEKDLRHSIIEKTDDYMTFEIKSICSSKGMLWVQCIPDYCPKDIFTDEELDYLAEKFDVEWD